MRHYMTTKPLSKLYSFAMVLDIDPLALQDKLNHDPMEIIRPLAKDNKRLRCTHVQEMFDVAHDMDIHFHNVEYAPCMGYGASEAFEIFEDVGQRFGRFMSYLRNNQAVLIGETKTGMHAVAWTGKKILDPRGQSYGIHDGPDFEPLEAWIKI